MMTWGILPQGVKKASLKRLGYIGKRFKIGPGCVIDVEKLNIGNNVEIGAGVVIKAKNLVIEDDTSIGFLSYIDCPKINLGTDVKIREQVYIGGMTSKDSSLIIGNHVTVFQFTVMNPTMPIAIGDGTGIGGNCMIFTHGSWLSVLDGYPVKFGPITIGNNVWIPWGVTILPGVKIGDGAVIGTGSLVNKDIPPFSLATGVPARIIKKSPDFPKKLSKSEKNLIFKEIEESFINDLRFKNATVSEQHTDDIILYSVDCSNAHFHLIFLDQNTTKLTEPLGKDTLVVHMECNNSRICAMLEKSDASWFILDTRKKSHHTNPIAKEFAIFVSRYGIRFI